VRSTISKRSSPISPIATPRRPSLHAAIEACAEGLREHPFLYRPGRIDGTREAVVHPNYILIYEAGNDQVTITAVVHSRQQYP
jgi:plasmid stabilization system protein ParE